MIKWICSLILVVIGYFAVAEEPHHEMLDWECEALFHTANGNYHLISQQPWNALEDFHKAKSILDKTGNFDHPINYLITFSEIIAYDCLGFDEQCRQSIGSLFLSMNEDSEEGWAENGSPTEKENEDSKVAIFFLQNLAILAPSDQVREFLFSFIEDMADQVLPAFEFAETRSLNYETFEFVYGPDQFSPEQCKSFWKKLKKWTREFIDWAQDIYKAIKTIGDAKKAYQELKKEKDFKLSYDEFNRYHNYYNNFNNQPQNR
jgi:hypothetical protein